MSDEEVLSEIHYYSTIIGIPICLLLFIPLTQQCRERLNNSKQEQDLKLLERLRPFTLLCMAFLCMIFAVIHMVLYIVSNRGPTLDDILCPFLIWTSFLSFTLSFYFFALFMLYRTKIVFAKPVSMRMKTGTFYFFMVFIHVVTLYKIIALVHYKFVWFDAYNICFPLVRDYIDTDTLAVIFKVRYWADTMLVVGLFVLFMRKLFKIRGQDPKIKKLILRTLICGVIACITTLVISIARLCDLNPRHFTTIDMVTNCICVVFSYKVQCPFGRCEGWSWLDNIVLFRRTANSDASADGDEDSAGGQPDTPGEAGTVELATNKDA